jgi:DNA-binding transcriptional ArsR family regulator
MVAIGLSAGSVARVRFAVSCLWEVVTSVRVLREPAASAVHRPWVRRVRPALVEAGLAGAGPVANVEGMLWRLIPRAPGYLPDFLTPVATGLDPRLDDELDALRATPAATVRHDLDAYAREPTGPLRVLRDDPAEGLRRLAGEIEAYWRIALAGDWPRIRVLLEGDVLGRARQVAEQGAAAMLNSLHEQIRWVDGALRVRQPACTAAGLADGGGLTLVPSVFAWPDVLTVSTGEPQLAYPARGLATLWEEAVRPAGGGLGAVVGHNRARLLAEMGAPVSTTELARRTGITAGGVSQHLAVLRAAGLVATHRHGRAVLNTRTPAADALLSAS